MEILKHATPAHYVQHTRCETYDQNKASPADSVADIPLVSINHRHYPALDICLVTSSLRSLTDLLISRHSQMLRQLTLQ
jgi:hypothetical protein